MTSRSANGVTTKRRLTKHICGAFLLGSLSHEASASPGKGVTPYSVHGPLIGIRDVPVPYDDKNADATVLAGIQFAKDRSRKECGPNPYEKGIEHSCHPRNDTYVRTGEVLRRVLTKANIMPEEEEFERYRLTMVLEASRSGMEYVTAMSVSESYKNHGVEWAQLEQHYSTSIDDPRTMSIYVDLERTSMVGSDRIRQAIDYVDAYRRGLVASFRPISDEPPKVSD